jgi:hypothetical protein
VGKPEGKRPLSRPRSRWVDNIKTDLREVEWGCMDWIDLAQDMEGSYEHGKNLRVPQNVRMFLSSCVTGGFSRRTQFHEVGYAENESWCMDLTDLE